MSIYSLSPLVNPQYIAQAASAALVFATPGAPAAVPSGFNYQIQVARVANITGSPVTLEVWRVPSGSSADNPHIIVPTINIPVASQTFPYFDLTACWGVVLQAGDAIWALAGTASALVIQGDGVVVVL